MYVNIPHAQVEALLREAATQIVMPFWRNLGRDDVTEKSAGDVTTSADTRCEAFLSSRLPGLIEGSLVLGEESVYDDPDLLAALQTDAPVWVIDPLDGTKYFAAGQPEFAIMVCLIQSGLTIGAWILNPIDGQLTSAERGCGAFQGDRPLTVDPSSVPLDRMRGVVATWYLPDSLRPTAEAVLGSFLYIERTRCAGYNYPSFAKNELHFLFFYRTLVWDHAPGALIAQEAGGFVRRLDGREYSPVDDRKGLLCATNPEMWLSIQRTLVPSVSVVG
ncbi:MAG: inositol monophosphatase [Gemmatimonadetes bacterium]|nr:inositol monophosphatase [Gemmatimonadota bacterium]MYG16107.1 inositol monophosphatase [Gemmatimonadota bacterium]